MCARRYSNQYDWRAFLAALLCSAGVAVLWSLGAWLLRKTANIEGPGIALLMRIPGVKYVTASPNWTPESQGQLPIVNTGDGSTGIGKDTGAVMASSPGVAGKQ
jgi:hypothetical protein